MEIVRKMLRMDRYILKYGLACALVFIFGAAAAAEVSHKTSTAAIVVRLHEKAKGFLSKDAVPDSARLLPPPPEKGSAAYAADEEAYLTTRNLNGTPRWKQAVGDAQLTFPAAAEQFSCELGVQISKKETPHLYKLLERSESDAYRATKAAKKHYSRRRPFVVNGGAICTPADEPHLRHSGSYPSAHAATGWAWALILVEIDPDRTDAILARGLDFGRSRVICGVHWLSDVEAGRIIGASVVARLHADPAFRSEVAAAAAELAAARAKKLKPARNCSAEAAALTPGH